MTPTPCDQCSMWVRETPLRDDLPPDVRQSSFGACRLNPAEVRTANTHWCGQARPLTPSPLIDFTVDAVGLHVVDPDLGRNVTNAAPAGLSHLEAKAARKKQPAARKAGPRRG